MKRLPDWDTRLVNYVMHAERYHWQTNNCCLFAARGIMVMTDIDLTANYLSLLSKEKNERGMFRLLKKLGGVEDIATKWLGQPKRASLAKRGDIVSHYMQNHISLGICMGELSVYVSHYGFAYIETKDARKAWSVD